MSDKTKLILGLVGAAAVGVAIGILLAPEAGADTRKKISGTASDWTDSLGDLFTNAKDSAKDKVSKLRRKGDKFSAQTEETYSDLRENYS